MMRCLKYSVTCGFQVPFTLGLSIRSNARALLGISHSRLTEEMMKILLSGKAKGIFEAFDKYGLLECFVPRLGSEVKRDKTARERIFSSLSEVDARATEVKERRIGRLIAPLAHACFDHAALDEAKKEGESSLFKEALASLRRMLEPLNLPRMELEIAVTYALRSGGYHAARAQRERFRSDEGTQEQREPRKRPRRRRGPRKGNDMNPGSPT
jgi:tRNA nucleotidyltransferase/poly(A) polymerase